MFELPDAKRFVSHPPNYFDAQTAPSNKVCRVRREDLNREDDSAWGDEGDEGIDMVLQARLNAQIAASLGMDIDESPVQASKKSHSKAETAKTKSSKDIQQAQPSEETHHNSDDDLGEFDFRLFSTGAPSKVVLEDVNAPLGEGGLAHQRPTSYYLIRDIPDSKKREYQTAAVSGEDIFARAKWPSWGMELPWKVTRATMTRKAKAGEVQSAEGAVEGEEALGKRKRPGKKRRIAVRIKAKAMKEKAEVDARKALDKEEQLKEKKKRLNRAKNLRKRAKNKEKKGAGDAGSGGESDEE